MKTKFFAVMLVVAMLLGIVGVAAAAPADAPRPNALTGDVTAINGNNLTVQTFRQGVVKVQTDANTKFHAPEKQNASLADVKVGDRIVARGNRTNDVLHANVVVIVPANLHDLIMGRAQSINGSTIVVEQKGGTTVNVVTSADTKFRTPDKDNATLADVKVGDVIEAAGVLSGNTLTAGLVRFHSPKLGTGPIGMGVIDSVSANSVTLLNGLTVNFTGSTMIVKRAPGGATIGSAADLVKGAPIIAIGTRSADDKSINAIAIVVGSGKGSKK